MRVLIQQTGTGLFLQDAQTWIKEDRGARIFSSCLDAIDFCNRCHLTQGVEVVLKFNNPAYDIYLCPFQLPPQPHLKADEGK